MRRRSLPSPALVVALVALVAAVGGYAIAAVPDKNGRIPACYGKKSGDLRVLVKGTKCKRGEKKLLWNQTGPTGSAGAPGQPGSPGQPGQDGAPGPAGGSMLTGNTKNLIPAAGSTNWLHPSGPSDFWGAPTFAEMLTPERAIVARDLAVRLGGPAGAGESYKITFLVDGAATALTCTVSGDTDPTCGDGTTTVAIPPRSRMAFQVDVSAGAVSRRVLFAWRAVEG